MAEKKGSRYAQARNWVQNQCAMQASCVAVVGEAPLLLQLMLKIEGLARISQALGPKANCCLGRAAKACAPRHVFMQ